MCVTCREQSKPGVTDPQLPNLEEWASLSVLVNADVCDGDIYGVRLKDFLEGVCEYAVAAALNTRLRSGERLSVEQVSRELQRQIYIEALNCGKGKKPDFRAVFDLFDENKNGEVSLAEFKVQLKRLQLVNKLAEHQLPTLLGMFTKSKHQVRFEDFVAFAMKGQKGGGKGGLDGSDEEKDGDDKDADEEDEQDIEDMTSNMPPVVITRNADCDWLLWHLYRESRKVDPLDPEGVITELQNRCAETEQLQSRDPAISVKELWTHLFELSLQGSMTQLQFLKSVQLLCRDSSGRDDDRVDYDVLCKYVIRMGREFNALVQKRIAEDEGKFGPLLAELKKYFKDLSQEKCVEYGRAPYHHRAEGVLYCCFLASGSPARTRRPEWLAMRRFSAGAHACIRYGSSPGRSLLHACWLIPQNGHGWRRHADREGVQDGSKTAAVQERQGLEPAHGAAPLRRVRQEPRRTVIYQGVQQLRPRRRHA